MRKKPNSKKSSQNSLKILAIFCVIVGLAIAASLGYRLFMLMRDSKFDSAHNFVVAFDYHNDIDVVAINPTQKTFSHLQVRGGKSREDTEKEISLLVDTSIVLTKPFQFSSLSTYFSDAAWHKDAITSSLNIYDLYRLSLLTKHIAPDTVSTQSIHLPFDPTISNTMLEQLFLDETIDQENKTVSIVNGAGVPGLGTRLEQALSVMGVNVISVTNADTVKSSSEITYFGDKSYTLTRLQRLLGLPVTESSSQGLSDIIILIGRDMGQTTKF
jgi:hypothetical protein